MPRPRLLRNVYIEPNVIYFKPAGIRMMDLEETTLTIDEFEALRLKDAEGYSEIEAAKKMKISQPTFNRAITLARKKLVDALVKGNAIRIEGGTFRLVKK